MGEGEESVLIQVRIPRKMVALMDELKRKGLYRSRSETVIDGIRHILMKYNALREEAILWAQYERGVIPQDKTFDDIPVTPREEAPELVAKVFGKMTVEELMNRVRRRGGS